VRNKSFVISAILAFLINFCIAESQFVFNIPDTTIPQGKLFYVPITGTIQQDDLESLSISFSFDALNLDIKHIVGGENYAIKCDTVQAVLNLSDLRNSTAKIECSDTRSISNDTICWLLVEGLAGPDTVSTLSINEIMINGGVLSDAEINSGLITVPNRYDFREVTSIGNNFPNPFAEQSKFKIQLKEKSKIEFFVYSSLGKLAFKSEGQDWLLLFKEDSGGISQIDDWSGELEEGKYILQMNIPIDIPSGGYYLLMVTNQGVFEKSFMLLK
jgi:hypothetical protein